MLRRVAPALASLGIEVAFLERHGTDRRRVLTISKSDDGMRPSAPSAVYERPSADGNQPPAESLQPSAKKPQPSADATTREFILHTADGMNGLDGVTSDFLPEPVAAGLPAGRATWPV